MNVLPPQVSGTVERVEGDVVWIRLDDGELRKVANDEEGFKVGMRVKIQDFPDLAAAMTGARQGELCALRWRDMDWVAGVIRIRRSYSRGRMGTPKSRRSSRAVPMADELAAELEHHSRRSAYQADDDLVFCHPQTGNPYDASKMRRRFKAALARAGLRPVRFHDLRHSFGTGMASAGAPIRAVQEWMGHRDSRTTDLYSDYSPDPSQGRAWAERAFGEAGINAGINLSESADNSEQLEPHQNGKARVGGTP